MVTYAMTKAPGRFAAGVAGSPVTDWATYDTAYSERFMGTPQSNPEGYAASDVSRAAGALAGRLLLVHANMDENVHYTNTARFIDGLVAAKKPFDMLVFPSERHGYRGPAARVYVNERIASFFAEHL
jgi:dipeptidyl-peptidase-4